MNNKIEQNSFQEKIDKDIELTPIVKSLLASVIASKSFDYKKELTRILSKKYLITNLY